MLVNGLTLLGLILFKSKMAHLQNVSMHLLPPSTRKTITPKAQRKVKKGRVVFPFVNSFSFSIKFLAMLATGAKTLSYKRKSVCDNWHINLVRCAGIYISRCCQYVQRETQTFIPEGKMDERL